MAARIEAVTKAQKIKNRISNLNGVGSSTTRKAAKADIVSQGKKATDKEITRQSKIVASRRKTDLGKSLSRAKSAVNKTNRNIAN